MKLRRMLLVPAWLLALVAAGPGPRAADWPEFLGPGGRGSAAAPVRTRWSETEGIAWRVDLPGRGASSPIVVGDLVIVTASSGSRQDRLHVIAFDRGSGQRRWERTFWATGRTLCHPTSAVAAGTPASDGRHVVALFSSCDLFGLDISGRLLWQRNLAVERPRAANDVGMGSSPRIVGDTVVVQIDCQGDAFAAGIALADGRDRWSVPRERIASWSSPLGYATAAWGPCVLLQNPRGLELRRVGDGSEAWAWRGSCAGIASTTAAGESIYVPGDGLAALVPGPDATPAWRAPRLSPGMASPLVWDGSVGCINRAGVLVVGDRASGDVRAQVRLAGSFWGSPIRAGDTIVAANKEGRTFLVSTAEAPAIVAENELPGTFTATPAAADGELYLRAETALWKVAAP